MNDDQINEFWNWFQMHQEALIEAVQEEGDTGGIIKELSERVAILQIDKNLPRLNWEIGPGSSKPWRLAFSPMVKKNMKLTEKIVAHAPVLSDWEFCPAKPPRMNSRIYSLRDDDGVITAVNIERWSYALRSFEGSKTFGVLLFPDSPIELDEKNKKKLGYLIVEGVLGEELFIFKIIEVEILEPRFASEWPVTRLSLLSKHISHLIKSQP